MKPERSLRGQLLRWLLFPLLFLIVINTWIKYHNARDSAELITDRILLASARAIAEQIKVHDSGIEVIIPPVALEMFATPDKDHVAYSLTGPDGTLYAGDPDLACSAKKPENLQPAYCYTLFRDAKMRTVALRQPLASSHPGETALVVVGVTLHSQDRVTSEIWRRNFFEQLLLVVIAGGLTWFGMSRGLVPLRKLRDSLSDRDPQVLQPFSVSGLQMELRPLVEALNEALERVKRQAAIRRRFIADASHQLRTPLTLLKTQASVGLREDNLSGAHDAFGAILAGIDTMTRLTNQLLTLARADPEQGPIGCCEVDLGEIARQAAAQYAGLASDRKIALVANIEKEGLHLKGEPTLLRELIANLVDNALKYTPEAGNVTLTLKNGGGTILARVEDSGPGIPLHEQEHVFKRFYRVLGTGVEGSGLGLSIVAEVARIHSASFCLFNRTGETGLCVEIQFPAG